MAEPVIIRFIHYVWRQNQNITSLAYSIIPNFTLCSFYDYFFSLKFGKWKPTKSGVW